MGSHQKREVPSLRNSAVGHPNQCIFYKMSKQFIRVCVNSIFFLNLSTLRALGDPNIGRGRCQIYKTFGLK